MNLFDNLHLPSNLASEYVGSRASLLFDDVVVSNVVGASVPSIRLIALSDKLFGNCTLIECSNRSLFKFPS